jgi:hypothetical protein
MRSDLTGKFSDQIRRLTLQVLGAGFAVGWCVPAAALVGATAVLAGLVPARGPACYAADQAHRIALVYLILLVSESKLQYTLI